MFTLSSLADLDCAATAVQFKNVATGQYIVLLPDPRGGGSLEGGSGQEPTPWYFYQAAGAARNNVEVKRKPVAGFNWSNYDAATDAASFIAWNHAKRVPSATTPGAPHDWYLEEAGPGAFRIRFRNGEYLELVPDLHFPKRTAPKIITRKAALSSLHQQWVITADRVAQGAPYVWPVYSPKLGSDIKASAWTAPTKFLPDADAAKVDTEGSIILSKDQLPAGVSSPWWCFRFGPNKNPKITAAAWIPMLQRFEADFAVLRDLGWPPDRRGQNGYYSTVYLWGSGLLDGQPNNLPGGWQGASAYQGENWPCVMLSYYPVACFDAAFKGDENTPGAEHVLTDSERGYNTGGTIHEGMHAIFASFVGKGGGCAKAGWFHEGANNAVLGQLAAEKARRAGGTPDYSNMGWLSRGTMIAPFMPIESYGGWLQDGSFGGPHPEDSFMSPKNADGKRLSPTRELLGGVQYSEAFPYFLLDFVSGASIPWIFQHCPGAVLEGLAASSGLGEEQVRRLILEFRSRGAFCDFGVRSPAYRGCLNAAWGAALKPEADEGRSVNPTLMPWTANPYAITTGDNAVQPTLTPDPLTLPGWSGANLIPLTLAPGARRVRIEFQPQLKEGGPSVDGMRCQIVHRAAGGAVVYSAPVKAGEAILNLPGGQASGAVIVVIANTDYTYGGDSTRFVKYDYRIKLLEGVTGAADRNHKWYA